MVGRVVLGITARPAVHVVIGHIDRLRDQGWDVHVVTGEPLDNRALPGVSVHHITMHRGPAPRADIAAWRSWRSLLKRLRPHAVVAATPKASLLAMTAAQSVGVPHRLWWTWGLHSDHPRAGRIVRAAERTTGSAATTVLAASSSLAHSLDRHGIHHRPLVLGAGAVSGVDLDSFVPATSDHPRRPTVTYLGRLSAAKGMFDLAKVWPHVTHMCPEAQLLLGGSPDPLDPADTAVQHLRTTGSVKTLGWVDDVAELLRHTDVLVLPSHREGLPAVVLEAAACETPAVVWDVVGSRDAVTNGVTGSVVPFGDFAGFAQAVQTLLDDPDARAAMGRAARSRVVAEFERSTVETRFVEFLSELIQSPVAPSRIDETRIAPQVALEQTSRLAGQPV